MKTATREKPLLMNGEMVRAVLDGRKTQTRRPAALNDSVLNHSELRACAIEAALKISRVQPGDVLWIRETWQEIDAGIYAYRADYLDDPHGPDGERSPEGRYRKWRPSIHMPRWAARLFLRVKSVRVERVNEISEADAIAEGIRPLPLQDASDPSAWWESAPGKHQARSAVKSFRKLWIDLYGEYSLYGEDSWNNDWCWICEFERIEDYQS